MKSKNSKTAKNATKSKKRKVKKPQGKRPKKKIGTLASPVASAVAIQLSIEGRWPPNDVTKVMSTDYRYDQFTMLNFLKEIQAHLLQGTPSYIFAFDAAFVVQALSCSVGALMNAIAARTH